MRQAITTISLLGSFTVFALTIDLFDTIFMFMLFGVVPGRVEPIPASQMLLIHGLATTVVVLFALRMQIISVFKRLRFTTLKRSNVA